MAINNRTGNTLLESGFFPPCRAATTGSNIALAGLPTIDGVALIDGDRVLVKDQTDQTTNGIYAVQSGNWQRVTDARTSTQLFDGMCVVVAQGGQNGQTAWMCTTTDDPVVIGTSLLTFTIFLALSGSQNAARIVTTPGALAVNISDSVVLLEAAITSISLPSGAVKNGLVTIIDCFGNFDTAACSVTVSGGGTMSGHTPDILSTGYQARTYRPLSNGSYVIQ